MPENWMTKMQHYGTHSGVKLASILSHAKGEKFKLRRGDLE